MKTSPVLIKQLVLEYFKSTGQNLNFDSAVFYIQSKIQILPKHISFDFKKLKYLVTFFFSIALWKCYFSKNVIFRKENIS